MQLSIRYVNNQLSLFHKGVDLLLGLSNEVKASCLERANVQLESELDQVVDKIEAIQDAHFLWAITWRPIRLDDLEGMIIYYYLPFICKELNKELVWTSISLSREFPMFFAEYLQQELRIPTKREGQWRDEVRGEILERIRPFKIFTKILKKGKVTNSIQKDAYWLVTNSNFELHRYRTFLDMLPKHQKVFFHYSHTRGIYNLEEGDASLNFVSFFKNKDIFNVLKRSYCLKNKVKAIKEPFLMVHFIKNVHHMEIMNMMLRDHMVERAMKEYVPKAVFMTTANTYPPARLVSRQAHIQGIPSVIVAARPMLTDLRPEERACHSDLQAKDQAKIGDYFVVWDLYSKNTLIEQGIPKDKVFVDQSLPVDTVIPKTTLTSCLLFLLSDDYLNEQIIPLFSEIQQHSVLNVAIKRHPGVFENKEHTRRMKELAPDLVDVTAYRLEEIAFDDVIVVTVNSSAGVEACGYGCGVIWLPFMNERSVIFYSVMRVLGVNFSSGQEFLTEICSSFNDEKYRKEFIDGCLEEYERNFMATHDVHELIPLLT